MEVRKIDEASVYCGIPSEIILFFIHEDWINPLDIDTPTFDGEDIARIELIWELRNELGVNDEAMPIILNLIDQLILIQLELEKNYVH